jgi:hypothetical protein
LLPPYHDFFDVETRILPGRSLNRFLKMLPEVFFVPSAERGHLDGDHFDPAAPVFLLNRRSTSSIFLSLPSHA